MTSRLDCIGIPGGLAQLVELVRTDQFSLLQVPMLFVLIVGLTGFVVFVERGQRRIPIQHARRVVGRRITQGGMCYFPLEVNTANVIPPIFASSLLIFPTTIAQFTESGGAVNRFFEDYLFPGGVLYNVSGLQAVEILLKSGATLTGTVRDKAGNPLEKIGIVLIPRRLGSAARKEALTGKDGRFSFGGLSPDAYVLRAGKTADGAPLPLSPWACAR